MSHIAVVLANGFEDSEFTVPCERLKGAGHAVTVVGTERGETVTGKRGDASAVIACAANDVDVSDYDALVIPGGQSPDTLRLDKKIVSLVRQFHERCKPIAAVCHGPQLLIEADVVRNRTMTSWPSVRKDLENAGAKWVDETVVEDGHFITSRKPDDLVPFCEALLRRLDDRQRQIAESA